MFSRLTVIFLVVLVAASMIPQTHAFTAGAGNIGNGKRAVDHKNQVFNAFAILSFNKRDRFNFFFWFEIYAHYIFSHLKY